jgi:hypothetical protein
MSNCDISNIEDRICKNLQGGIDAIYLFPFVKYSRSQIKTLGQKLVQFPTTFIYTYFSQVSDFSENTNIERGNVTWTQTLNFELLKTYEGSEAYKLVNKDYRAIFIDRVGNIRIIGLYNGCEATVTDTTGSDKSSANSYQITITAKEDNQAYYIDALDPMFPIDYEKNYIFNDVDKNFIFNDSVLTNYIFND